MNFMSILSILIGIILVDFLPLALIVGLIRLILKKKISKGWCVFVFILTVTSSYLIALLITGKSLQLGFLDYAIHFGAISVFLYDKSIPSILDTEKELKRKSNLAENCKQEQGGL